MGLKQTVDYDQGFVTTKLGCLGIKVWVFTNFAPLKGKSKGRFECLKRITEKGEHLMDSDTEPTKAQWTLPQGGGKSKEPENSQNFCTPCLEFISWLKGPICCISWLFHYKFVFYQSYLACTINFMTVSLLSSLFSNGLSSLLLGYKSFR
jgi:hypothetical protein